MNVARRDLRRMSEKRLTGSLPFNASVAACTFEHEKDF
jgi:hypothetical protein